MWCIKDWNSAFLAQLPVVLRGMVRAVVWNNAEVAQLVEQQYRKLWVVGSIPILGYLLRMVFMYWTIPPRIKVYEALWSLWDKRIELVSPFEAKIFSSSGNKCYTITYDPGHRAIMMNDNGAYRKWYLGYTGIAYLMMTNVLPYNELFADALKGIAWKDINTKYKNDFDLTQNYVDELLVSKWIDMHEFSSFVDRVLTDIETLHFAYLGKKILPPKWY